MYVYDIEFKHWENLEISIDTWKKLLSNQDIFNENMKKILFSIYSFVDHSATVKELEDLTDIKYNNINLIIGTSAKKIKAVVDDIGPVFFEGREIYYPYMFIGYKSKNGFIFEIRKNLREAMESLFSDLTVSYYHSKELKKAIPIDDNSTSYDLLSDVKEIVRKYPNEKKKKFGKTSFYVKMTKDMNNKMTDFLFDFGLSDTISSSMHVGRGSWVTNPWIGIHDKSYAIYNRFSFQNSLHLSYIIKCENDNPTLTLEINQGYKSLDLDKEDLKKFLKELFKYLNFIPEGFKPLSDDLHEYTLLSKDYDIKYLNERTLENNLRSLLSVFEHILPFHNNLLKKYLKKSLSKKVLEDFKEIMDEYPRVINKPLKNNDFAKKMRKDFTDDVELWVKLLTDTKYTVKISNGMGKWSKRPWVGIRLNDASKSFEEGLYVIYHFNFDRNNVDLSINQGLTNYSGKKRNILINRANILSTKVNNLDTFSKDVDSSFKTNETAVLLKFYDLNELTQDVFEDDLNNLLNEYVNIIPEYNNLIESKDENKGKDKGMGEEKYGLLNVNERNIWKISPGKLDVRDEVWTECKDKGFISIGFSSGKDIDYSIYNSIDELKEALMDANPNIDESSTAFQMIWNFVHEVKTNDIIVANNGMNGKVYGIGIVESEYIPPKKLDINISTQMRHVRKINWIISDEFESDVSFDRKTITKLSDEKWNLIVNALLNLDVNLKSETLKCIFDEFDNNYNHTAQSEELFNKYSECSEKFKTNFENIKISINDGNDETDNIFYSLIDPEDSLFKGFASDKKQMIKKSFNRSEDELSQIATLYLNLIDNYTSSDEQLRHEIFKFDDNELTKSIKTAYVSASLYFLDNYRFYTINQKTISTVKFLSNFVDISINLDNKLVNYVDNNKKYHEYITKIKKYLPELNTFEKFDHFCHWLCDKKLGFYASSGKLPLCLKNYHEEEKLDEIIETRSFNIKPDEVKTSLKINKNILYQSAAILNGSKNIIFEGVPGTGKTRLARDICEYITEEHMCNDFLITTATSDWTTFDVIGGLMPDSNGNLNFEEGIFLKAIRENKLLIIDEINRADIDKAFGQLFTVLSGYPVELNYKIDEKNISISHTNTLESYYDNSSKTYYIGENFRILATMNNYDKTSLYDLSYAFMRRFGFVEVDIPTFEDYESLINLWNDKLVKRLPEEYVDGLIQLLKLNEYRKLGPAIFYDMMNYIENRLNFKSNNNILQETILSYVFPQFEGLSKRKLEEIKKFLIDNELVDEAVIEEKFNELNGLNF